MKVLMIAPQPFFEPRGTPISVFQRLEALSTLGHEVDLVTYHVGKDVEFPNMKIHRVPKIKMIQHVRVGPSRAKLLLDVLVFLKAFRLLLSNRYDVIHSHEEASFFGMLLSRLFWTRHFYDMHSVLSRQLKNFDFGNNTFFIKVFEQLEKMVLKTCSVVIVVGHDLEDYVKALDPKIAVVLIENIALHSYQTQLPPGAIELLKETYNLGSRLPILYTGTFERYQGLDLALDCVRQVANHFPNVIFIFVGAKNKQRDEWTTAARERGLGEHTLFLDVVSPEESMVFLACSTILISPRLNALSTPLKIYSYLQSGRPIVATNISAHTQVLNSDTALLVDPNPEAFAQGIIRLLESPEEAENLGKNAHQYAMDYFNYKDYLAKISQVYQAHRPGQVKGEQALSKKISE